MGLKRNDPPPSELRKYLSYDPDTGEFSRKCSSGRGQSISRKVGCRCRRGYLRICFRKRQYLAHLLAWWFEHDAWPDLFVDHANRDVTDNRIANLRLATGTQNAANQAPRRTGMKGAFKHRDGGWTSTIGMGGRTIYLGYFKTEAEAAAAYAAAAPVHHGQFARTE